MKPAYLCVSAKSRKALYVMINIVSVVATVLCALYLGVVVYSLYRHRFILHDLIISLFDDLYTNLIALGVLLFILSVVSFKLNTNLKRQPTNHSLARSHRVWVVLTMLTLLATAICASLMTSVESVVDEQVGPRLKLGLTRYLETPSWSSALDRIQGYLKCCGVHGPPDWYANAWIPMTMLTGHNVDNKLVQPNGRVQVPLVPTSCCRVVSAECGHRAWIDTKTRSWRDIKPANASLLYTVGCEEAIKDTVSRDMLIFKIILLVVFVLQMVLVVGARYLYSSTMNSVMLGRPQGKAPGWLIGPRLFGGKKRYGYLQDYDDRCQHIKTGGEESFSTDKKKWKCLPKLRCRKSDKGSHSEEVSQSSEGRRKGFKSPYLTKLKSPKCVAKLKESCSRKFKKKKNKDVEYTAIEAESDFKPEERKRSYDSNLNKNEKLDSDEPYDSGRKKNSERLRTGGNEQKDFDTNTGIEKRPVITTRNNIRKKISENLIDLEDTFEQKHKQLEVYQSELTLFSPFSSEYAVGRPSSSRCATSGNVLSKTGYISVCEPKKQASVVVEDFKERRELFEKVAKNEGQTSFVKVEPHKTTILSPYPRSLKPIDLDAVESAKSLSIGGSSGTEITTVSSVKHEANPHPVVLRNYPGLYGLD